MAARGLYIHIPYCVSKCGYCDFTSYTNQWETVDAYIEALSIEASRYAGCAADTVYIGGGTPSCLQIGKIPHLLEAIGKYIVIENNAEITIEANPNSLTAQKAAEYYAAGINRLSIGLQAVQPELLRSIGRKHVYEDFLRALDGAVASGFSNISADLMYSLPGQTVEQAAQSAAVVAALPVAHISAYALRLEPGTPMYGMPQPDEEQDRAMFYAMLSEFSSQGFSRYEISNFAKSGYECQHNLKYWREEEYIGLGVAAHSYYQGFRYGNTDDIAAYIEAMHSNGVSEISREAADVAFETIMLRTRLKEGIPMSMLPNTDKMQQFISMLVKNQFAECKDGRMFLTNLGMDIHNTIVLELTERLS